MHHPLTLKGNATPVDRVVKRCVHRDDGNVQSTQHFLLETQFPVSWAQDAANIQVTLVRFHREGGGA